MKKDHISKATGKSFSQKLQQFFFLTPIKSEVRWAFVSASLLAAFLLVPGFFNRTQLSSAINGVILLIFMAALFDYIKEMIHISKEINEINFLKNEFKSLDSPEIKKRIMQYKLENIDHQGIIMRVMHIFKNQIDRPDEAVSAIFTTAQSLQKNTSYFENSVIFIGMSGTLIHLSRNTTDEAPFSCAIFGIFAYLAIVFLKNIFERYSNIFRNNFNIFYAKIFSPILFEEPEQIELKDISENIKDSSLMLKNTTDALDDLIRKISHNVEVFQSFGNLLVGTLDQLKDNQQDINNYFDKFENSTEHFISHSKAVEISQEKNSQNFEAFVNSLSEVKSLQESFNDGIYKISGSMQSKVIDKADKLLKEAERLAKQREMQIRETLKRMDQFLTLFDEKNRKVMDN